MRERRRKRQSVNWFGLVLGLLVLAALACGVGSVVRLMGEYGRSGIADSPVEPVPETRPEEQKEPSETEERFAGVAVNSYAADGFYKEDGFLHYADPTHTSEVGVDISSHQQTVDWAAVREAGVDFAILRAGYRGYTEGTVQEDARFRENLRGAKEAGLKVGVYFFSQALDKAEAVEEAEFVLELLDGETLDYPIFFDWEDIEAEARTDGMDPVTLTDCAVVFCKRVELNGYRGGVYFNQRFGYEEFDLQKLQDYVLWLAEYDRTPGFAYHFSVWQYANDGMLSGVEGPVDLNLAILETAKE